ncbi:MAG: hypothetical protein JNN20_15495 [Betaproteobacteria bacterium]|nr:hypothetical protein [Betaproteobacteria bacterium]
MRFRRISTLLLPFFLVLFTATAAVAQKTAPQPLLDELMVKSGLWKQMDGLQSGVLAGIDEAQQSAKVPASPATTARLKQVFSKAYAPDRMRADMREQLGSMLTVPEQREILSFLKSNLGVRMTRLDEKYSDLAEYNKAARAAPDHLKQLAPERIKRVQRMVQSLRADEGMATIVINNQVALISGISLAAPDAKPVDLDALRRKMDAERSQLVATISQQLTGLFAYMYRELSDADLDQFDAFANSAVGRKYHASAIEALDKVMVKASLAAGFELAGNRLKTESKASRS